MQMYKVFVNDCPIILTDNNNFSTGFKKMSFEECLIEEQVDNLFNLKEKGICLICNDLEVCWSLFKSKFKIQKAAGGKVFNAENKVLFIKRFDKWDLPKGKLEKGESIEVCAIREVEEECGISNLRLENELQTTYHIFKRKKKTILKITHWFVMFSDYKGKLKPQTEEGITEVVFKDELETKEALENTYQNIKLLF
jgi:8-oxo-dGTP pyrophosphatase MutT (NUDIX family)